MSRTPKLGEVWTGSNGTTFTCIDAEPDDAGDYGWAYFLAGKALKAYEGVYDMTPPKAEPPEWLKAAPWFTCEPSDAENACSTLEYAQRETRPDTLGYLNVLTGEWVER
jgi:hypothetical protein